MKPARQRARRPAATRSTPSTLGASVPAGTVLLASVVSEEAEGWRVKVGSREQVLPLDGAVDPELVREALVAGARVLVEAGESPSVVGVVQTSRALRVDRRGVVDAVVERLQVMARQGATVKTSQAFVQVKGADVELYGTRVLTRAREVAKVLARMINLN